MNNTTFVNNTIGPATSFAGTYKGTAVSVRNGGNTTIVNSLAYASNNYIPSCGQQYLQLHIMDG
ncbi:hypothetical protein LWM68_00020 [Niabella sp. W65]|nr:hypothetical protein [Niabella sp. W65]MCH7361312.1 hypothetical protein [Niabella sp. W65]